MKTNIKRTTIRTHEGAPAKHIKPEQQLERSVMACLLWENSFYEDGEDIANRIVTLADQCDPVFVAQLAEKARHEQHLRHAPLLLLLSLINRSIPGTSNEIRNVISRPDEILELVSLYWLNGKRPLTGQLRKGINKTWSKFDEYQYAKYTRRNQAVTFRDVLRLTHPKPQTPEQSALFKNIVDGALSTPDTWEVALSGGADKKATFERLLREKKLGYMALLRNLRNMHTAKVDRDLVAETLLTHKGIRQALPFRFIAAARAVPQWEPIIDPALMKKVEDQTPLPGETFILVDVSGSMDAPLSRRSDMRRIDAAAGLAAVAACETQQTFAFAGNCMPIPTRKGMAGVDTFNSPLTAHGLNGYGTNLGDAVLMMNRLCEEAGGVDRLIVITDEQSHQRVPNPNPKFRHKYMINVSTERNGVGYKGGWTHIDGFSESVLKYVAANEESIL